jgi:repressor LexA
VVDMHIIQQKILKLAETEDVLALGIRPLGRLIGINSPQLVKHHLNQLLKKGQIKPRSRKDIKLVLEFSFTKQPSLVEIPVLGAANCGPATIFADEHLEKYIYVSESLLKKRGNVFALIAKGNSLDMASVDGKNIEEDDYVLIDGDQRNPSPGDYVLSVINDCANIKKFARSKDGNIALLSESTSKYPPIYIGEDDNFMINGKVIQVIKAVEKE